MSERKTFLEMPLEAEGFHRSFAQAVSALKRGGMQSVVAEENIQRFSHGRRWNHRANPYAVDGEMRTLSTEWNTPFQEIVDGDLALIPRAIQSITKEMHGEQMRMMYQMIRDTCEATGQTVDAATAGSTAAAFLEMLQGIEFGIDREGNVSMPQIHAGPEMAKKLVADLESQPPEFVAKVEQIKTAKSQAALARERERKGKFKTSNQE